MVHGGILSGLFDSTTNPVGLVTMNNGPSDINNDDSSPTLQTNPDESYDYLQRMVLVSYPTTSNTIAITEGVSTEARVTSPSSSVEDTRRSIDGKKRNTNLIHEMVEQRVNRMISSEKSTQSTARSNNVRHPTNKRPVPSNQSFDQFSSLTPQHLSFTTTTKMTTTTKSSTGNSNCIIQSQSIHDVTQQPTPLRGNPSDDWKNRIDATSTTLNIDDHPASSKLAFYKKYESILQCLNGRSSSGRRSRNTMELDVENDFVDLWELRELAVGKGGLLCPSLRKRAWPILCNAHVDVILSNYHQYVPNLQDGTASAVSNRRAIRPSSVVISQADRQALTSDIKYKFKKYDTNNSTDCSVSNGISTLSSSSSIVSDCVGDDEETIHATMSSDENRQIVMDDDGTSANYSNLRANVSIKSLYQTSERKVKKRTLFNIISTVLQQEPHSTTTVTVPTTIHIHEEKEVHLAGSIDWSNHSPIRITKGTPPRARCNSSGSSSTSCDGSDGSSYIDDHSFHHYDGLVDLTDVLLSNLDSPSLTTLILTKLANYHLRDALRMTSATSVDRISTSSPSALDTGVMLLFVPLLRSLEYGLYKEVIVTACQKYHPDGLASGIQTLCSIIAKHMSTWFCSAFCDTWVDTSPEDRNEAASRLVDVCMVSHPLFPLYVAVSVLAVRKERNSGCLCSWDSRENLSGQFTRLFYLNTIPTTGISNAHHVPESTPLLEVLEEVISMSLHYMKRLPPDALIAKANISSVTKTKRLGPSLRHISCLHTIQPPNWFLAARTPTECTLVMQRGRLDTYEFSENDEAVDKRRYPKAFTACSLDHVSTSAGYHHIRQVGSPTSNKRSIRRGSSFQSLRGVVKTVRFQDDAVIIQSCWNDLSFSSRQSFGRILVAILISLLVAITLLLVVNFSASSRLTQSSSTSDSIAMKSVSSVVSHSFPSSRNLTSNSVAEKRSVTYTNTSNYFEIYSRSTILQALNVVSPRSTLTSKLGISHETKLQRTAMSHFAFDQYLNDRQIGYESSIAVRNDAHRAVHNFKGKSSSRSSSPVVFPRLYQESVSSYSRGMMLDMIKSVLYISFLRKVGLMMYLYNFVSNQGSSEGPKSSFAVSNYLNRKSDSTEYTNINKLQERESVVDKYETQPLIFLSSRIKSLHVQMKRFTTSVTKHSISLLQLHGASRYMAIANASHIVVKSFRIVNSALNLCMDGAFDLVIKSLRYVESNLRALIIYLLSRLHSIHIDLRFTNK